MLGIDTNVLVRFLVRDDENQFEKARKLIRREVAAGHRVFVNQLVLMETEWVLRSRYAVPKNQILEAISGLLNSTDIQFEDEPSIEETLFIWKESDADFADCLHAALALMAGQQPLWTFDKAAAKVDGAKLLTA